MIDSYSSAVANAQQAICFVLEYPYISFGVFMSYNEKFEEYFYDYCSEYASELEGPNSINYEYLTEKLMDDITFRESCMNRYRLETGDCS